MPGCEEFLVTCGTGGSFPSLPFCRRSSLLALFQGLHFKTMVLRSSKSRSVLLMWVLNASLRVEGLLSSFCPFSQMLINIVCISRYFWKGPCSLQSFLSSQGLSLLVILCQETEGEVPPCARAVCTPAIPQQGLGTPGRARKW